MAAADDDIASLFFGDDDSAPAKAQALAQALRGQQRLGTLGMLTGDKVLSGVGQQLLGGADSQQKLFGQAANMRLQRMSEAEKQKTEADWRHTQEVHMANQDALARQQLAQGNFTAVQANQYGPGGMYDHKKGVYVPFVPSPTAADGKPLSQKDIDKEFKDLTEAISTNRGRGNLNVEQQKRLNASDRIKAIAMNPDGTPRDLSPGLMTELAGASAGLITGGSPAEHTIAAMTPSSVGSDWAKIEQWLTNEPKGTGQQKFVQTLLDQAKREEDVIKPQIHAAQLQPVPNYMHLSKIDKKNQTRFESILKAAGLDASRLDENGLEKAMEAVQAAGGLAPDKAKRLAELRAKQAAGQLK